MIAAVVALAALVALLAAALVARSGVHLRRRRPGERRILVPFSGGTLDATVLDAAIRIARAEGATLVPAYIVIVPMRYSEDSPLVEEVGVAMPLLEAVERAAVRAGVPVDARIEKGRSLSHALRLLWEAEDFDRIVAPATLQGGFTSKDLAWLLENAPAETLVLKPEMSPGASPASLDGGRYGLART
ncbi:MAG: universal stress protein [Verrucomicrobiota bacterium]